MSFLLLCLLMSPLVGAGLAWAAEPLGTGFMRRVATGMAWITFLLVLGLTWRIWPLSFASGDVASYQADWWRLGEARITFHVGVDGWSLCWLLLTSFVTAAALSQIFASARTSLRDIAPLLLLEAALMMAFTARDVVLFFVCLEVVWLLWLVCWIHADVDTRQIWGFIGTSLAGSGLLLLGLAGTVAWHFLHSATGWQSPIPVMSFDMEELTGWFAWNRLPGTQAMVLFWALFAGFLLKTACFPFHGWYVSLQAASPASSRVVLGSLVLPLPLYGLTRTALPWFSSTAIDALHLLLIFSVAGLLFHGFRCWDAFDASRRWSYWSLAQMSIVLLGFVTLNSVAVQGAALSLVAYSLANAARWLLDPELSDHAASGIKHPSQGNSTSGLGMWAVFVCAGVPGSGIFVGNALVLVGVMQSALGMEQATWRWAVGLTSVAGVAALLLAAGGILRGFPDFPSRVHIVTPKPQQAAMPQGTFRAAIFVVPLIVGSFVLGLFPHLFWRGTRSALELLGPPSALPPVDESMLPMAEDGAGSWPPSDVQTKIASEAGRSTL